MTQALFEVLGRPATPQEALSVLRDHVGFSDKEIARAVHVTDRTVKRWRTGTAISTEAEEMLFDLVRIVSRLVELDLPAPNVRAWFFYRNSFLGEERPIDVFATEGFEAVQPALTAIADAAFA